MKFANLICPFLCVVWLLFSTGCLEKKREKEPEQAGIQWSTQGLEAALQSARRQKKPLFVYWGAKWCPPCHVIRSTVFKDPKFIAATQQFVSVYLDGDTESAQEWGEKLHAQGYPTLMVLNAEGREVVRLSSSMTAAEFSESLNSIAQNMYPIGELIEKMLAAKAEDIAAESWRVVAGYAWAQAHHLPHINWASTYSQLEAKIPETFKVEKNQLFFNSLVAHLAPLKEGEKLAADLRQRMKARLEAILGDSGAVRANLKTLSLEAETFVSGLTDQGHAERGALVEKYKKALAAVRPTLPAGSYLRLASFYPVVGLPRLEGESVSLSAEEKARIQKEMVGALETVENSNQQVFVTNTASYVLREAGFSDLARDILLKDIKKSKTPYYSMAALARLEKKLGRHQEALRWMERAYSSSEGLATRLQWGSSYVLYLMDLVPDQEGKILQELQKFFHHHLKLSDAFMGRNKKRLQRIANKTGEWAKSRLKLKAQLIPLKQRWMKKCQTKSKTKTDLYRQSCKEYFTQLI